jgi:inorganic pyrophosphatase
VRELIVATPLLSHLPTVDPTTGDIATIIETPRGSSNKFDYDESCGAFRLSDVLPEGSTFPYDFGFVPSTLGEDGDPLDVLVFLDGTVPAGCLITVRLIGVIEAKQRTKNGPWIRNDRLLAVAAHAHTHAHVKDLDDLRPNLLDEIEDFFRHYNEVNGKEFKPLDRSKPKKARQLIERGMEEFRNKQAGQPSGRTST